MLLKLLPSMRLRIAVAVAAFSLFAILAMSLAQLQVFQEKEDEFIDGVLGEQIAYSMRLWDSSPELAFPNTPDMRLFRRAHGAPLPEGLPRELAGLTLGNHEIFIEGREYHVAVRDDGKARFTLLYDVEDYEFRFASLAATVVTGGLLLSIVLLLGSYFLAGQLTLRLERLAAKVASDRGERLVEPGMAEELLALARVLEAARARQAQAIERERAFAANLSHELRTPLTAIRTDAELIAAAAVPDAVLRRAGRIVNGVDRINATAASLLMLAREARPRDAQSVDLAATVERLWENLGAGSASAVELQLAIPEGCCVRGDPAFVELVLRNLLDNALHFSAGGTVRCSVTGTVLCVADSGPGFAAEALGKVFERVYSGRQDGHGLGLSMVRLACEASGWQVQAGNGAGGGEIRVDFGGALVHGSA